MTFAIERPPIQFDIGGVPADGLVYALMWIAGAAVVYVVGRYAVAGARRLQSAGALAPVDMSTRLAGTLLRNLLFLVVAALLVPVIEVALHSTYQVTISYDVALYVMLAIGLNIVVGYTGLLDLGFVAFFAIGGYTWALLSSPQLFAITHQTLFFLTPTSTHPGYHISMLVVLPLAGFIAAGFGVLIGIPTLRLRGDYLAIVTLGFGEIIRILANNLDFPLNVTNGPRGVYDVDSIQLGTYDFGIAHTVLGITIPAFINYYLLMLVVILVTVFFVSRLATSRVGRAWAAIREDELAAEAAGIHTRNLKLLAYASGGFFGGVAGAIFAAGQHFIDPTLFGFDQSIFILVLVVVGGMGSIPGVVFGAVLVGELFYNTAQAGALRQLVFGILLVIMIIVKPDGLLPSRQRKRELATVDELPPTLPPHEDSVHDLREAGA